MKTFWAEQDAAVRILIVVLALVLTASPVGVALLMGRTHAAGRDSPLDFVRAEQRTVQAVQTLEEATWVAELETLWAMPAPTFVPDAVPTGTPLPRPDAKVSQHGPPTLLPAAGGRPVRQGLPSGSKARWAL